ENLELMTYLLRAFGHAAMTTSDGERGVEMARHDAPDLVLCDVQLPGIDGYEVVRRLKADGGCRTPVVAVTALAMSGDREKGLATGFDGYIAKPIDPERFVAQIEAFVPPEKRGTLRAVGNETVPGAVPSAGRRATVLVVDDSPTNRELIYQTLVPSGYRVHLAETVKEALALAVKLDLDLILSDLHMPGEDGFRLIREVKADSRLAKLPFMFISS